jgi:hypothetical protein
VIEREWREASDMRSSPVGIAVVVASGAALRFWALGHAPVLQPGTAEADIVATVARMLKTGDLNPHYFACSGFYLYLQLAVAACRFLWGAGHGLWTSLDQPGAADFLLWGRAVTAAFSTATVILVYAIARRWGSRTALLAAALIAVLPDHVRDAHYVLADVPMTFFVTLAFLFTLRAHEKPSPGAFALAGVTAGLAAGTQYSGGVALLLPLAAALVMPAARAWRGRAMLAAVVSCAAVYLLISPYTLLDLPGFLNGVASTPGGSARALRAGARWAFYAGHVESAVGWPGLVLLGGGTAMAVSRAFAGPGRARSFLLVFFPVAFFCFVGLRADAAARHLLPIFPFVAVLAATSVVSGVSALRRFDMPRLARSLLIATGTVALLAPPLVASVQLVRHNGARMDRDGMPNGAVVSEQRTERAGARTTPAGPDAAAGRASPGRIRGGWVPGPRGAVGSVDDETVVLACNAQPSRGLHLVEQRNASHRLQFFL